MRLNAGPPQSESLDTIAVSRPKRESSSLRIRYSANMNVADDEIDDLPRQMPKPSPAASSELSSLSSLPPGMEKEPSPSRDARPTSVKTRDYSRDFMSYYVAGADDEEDQEDEAPPPQPVANRPVMPQQAPAPIPAPVPAPASAVQPPLQQQTRFKNHSGPQPTYPPPRVQQQQPPPQLPSQLPPQVQPSVQLVDSSRKPSGPRGPDTIADMITKLEALSVALTKFGGVPAVPMSPKSKPQPERENASSLFIVFIGITNGIVEPKKKTAPKPKPNKKVPQLDNFLAMFDDDDDDDEDDEDDTNETDDEGNQETLDYRVENPGTPDAPLMYGIQFIQNALKSWAQQRLNSQYAEAYRQQFAQHAHSQPQKRGPGRPRKFDNAEEDTRPPLPPLTIQMDLAKTVEGNAINAFQDVLEAGCLQVNAELPTELTRALRHLYMQIDQLINQGSRNEAPWQCMSYSAQIAAQKVRVQKAVEAEARMREEVTRQQELAHVHLMQQMGVQQPPRGLMSEEQASHEHAVDLECRRSAQHAAQHPHLRHSISVPMSLNPHQAGTPTNFAASPSPVKAGSASSPVGNAHPAAPNGPPNTPHGLPIQSTPEEAKRNPLERVKMYTPGYLPLSGQSMKFSFVPDNPQAINVFGAQAFPSPNNGGPNLPNRGPMSASAAIQAMQRRPPPPLNIPNEHGPAPVLGSNAPTPVSASAGPVRSPPASGHVVIANAEHVARPPSAGGNPVVVNGIPTLKDVMNKPTAFAPVTGQIANQRPSSVPAGSPTATAPSPVKPSIEMTNGTYPVVATSAAASPSVSKPSGESKSAGLASRFPHPGAVVVDQ